MAKSDESYQLALHGAFRLTAPDGKRLDIVSKRGQALIAMLAMAGGGERKRSWLQDRLWGSRAPAQAQASLRRELSTLRSLLNGAGDDLLHSDHHSVWLDLPRIEIDAREVDGHHPGEFLEGLDLSAEEGFEDWLREERARAETRSQRAAAMADSPAPVPLESSATITRRPAIAVLPFTNGTGDSTLVYLAEGLSEDLIDRLSRLRWLPVIARSSSFGLKDAADARAAGAALGARYVLEGQLRQSQSGLALSASLSDAEIGEIVWSNRIDLPEPMLPDALAQLLGGMTTNLDIRIDQQEQRRTLYKPQSDLNVRELIWKGRWHLNTLTRADAAQAQACFTEALEREPGSPEALIQLTMAKFYNLWTQRGDQAEIRAFRQLAQRAIIADHQDARGHMLAGIAEIWLRQPLRAEALLQRAIDLNPSLFLAHGEMGSVLYLRDQPEAALVSLETALRLSPNDHTLFYLHGEMAMAHLMLGNYAQATARADQAIMLRQAYWYGHVVKVNALARSGDSTNARLARQDLQASVPNFDPAFADWLPFIDPSWNRFLRDGLNL